LIFSHISASLLFRQQAVLDIAHPEAASFGPILRSRIFPILDVEALRLRSKKSCGLALNQNLLFLDGQ
jgi:hypothetical protein